MINKSNAIKYYENFPQNWSISYLSNLISLVSGADLQPTEYSESNIGIPYLTGASNISESNKIIINRYTFTKYINSHINDILISCKGTNGKIVKNDIGDILVARQFMALKSFIPNNYLIIYLKSIVSELNDEAKSMIPGIDRKQILIKIVFLPPHNEQLRISNITNNIFGLIDD